MPRPRPVRFGPSTAPGVTRLVAAWTVRSALVVAAVLTIHYSVVRGRVLQRTAPEIFLGAAPFVGRNFRDGWDWRFSPTLLIAGAVAALLAWLVSRRWWWTTDMRVVLGFTGLAAVGFAAALAATDGRDGFTYGAADKTEYLANLAGAPPAAEFVDTYVERINDYTVHVRGHPPGFVLVLKVLAAVGLDGIWPAVALSLVGVGVTAMAVASAVWGLGDNERARAVAPLLVVTPGAIWMVTSADAVFAALGAVTVAALVWAHRCRGPMAAALGTAAGLAYGALLFSTYGGAVFALVPLAITAAGWRWRRPGLLVGTVSAIAGCSAVTAAFAAVGFWWFDGLDATQFEYWEGTAQFRTAWYFVAVNVSVALIVIGPAVVAAVLWAGRSRLWVLAGAGLACVVASIASQYSKGEIERIWLLFYPWITVIGACWIGKHRRLTSTLAVAAQSATAIALQAALISKW